MVKTVGRVRGKNGNVEKTGDRWKWINRKRRCRWRRKKGKREVKFLWLPRERDGGVRKADLADKYPRLFDTVGFQVHARSPVSKVGRIVNAIGPRSLWSSRNSGGGATELHEGHVAGLCPIKFNLKVLRRRHVSIPCSMRISIREQADLNRRESPAFPKSNRRCNIFQGILDGFSCKYSVQIFTFFFRSLVSIFVFCFLSVEFSYVAAETTCTTLLRKRGSRN